MATITIKNVGPIKEVIDLKLNKVNVFMGPQSSGKSTIAKIISYCTWVEKDVATARSLESYEKNKKLFRNNLESFHKIKGYFRADSYISYKSNVVEIKWENEQSSLNWISKDIYKRSKIAYIPSERNMVILPDVRKVELGHSNIRSFLFDWFDARAKYNTKESCLPLLGLGVNYYFADSSEEDRIFGKNNGAEYEITLSNASSGLQSITPLIALIDYLTRWIYLEDKTSFEQEERERKANYYLVDEKIIKPYFGEKSFSEDRAKMIDDINEGLKRNDKEVLTLYNDYVDLLKNLFSTQNSQFIIEEPEQNLFPETQRDLIYHLLEKCLGKEENRLTITTHSPYILYALNNCMMGGLVNSQLEDKEKEEYLANNFLSDKSWIDPELVSVWEIEDGKLRNIQDKDNIISENYFDKKMTEITDEYSQMLNYYNDEE